MTDTVSPTHPLFQLSHEQYCLTLSSTIAKLTRCAIYSIDGCPVDHEINRLIADSVRRSTNMASFRQHFARSLWMNSLSPGQRVHYWLDDNRDSLLEHLGELRRINMLDNITRECERRIMISNMLLLLSPNYPLNSVNETQNCTAVLSWIADKHRTWLEGNKLKALTLPEAHTEESIASLCDEDDCSEGNVEDESLCSIDSSEDFEDHPQDISNVTLAPVAPSRASKKRHRLIDSTDDAESLGSSFTTDESMGVVDDNDGKKFKFQEDHVN